jgi:hypothetical protein
MDRFRDFLQLLKELQRAAVESRDKLTWSSG